MKGAGARRRNPERTRERLLAAAFRGVYHSGFQGSDIERIPARAKVTKGALYHFSLAKNSQDAAVPESGIHRISAYPETLRGDGQ